MTVIDTPEGIAMFRLLSMRGRLRLEMRGLRFKGRPTLAVLRSEGITSARTRAAGLADLNRHIEQLGGPAEGEATRAAREWR
jgi:hypothetical protein